jgi:hypothetical protein
MSQGPWVGFIEPLLEPEPPPELELPLEPEPLLEPELLELELPPICMVMVPVVIGFIVCGVIDNMPPDAQYAKAVPPEFVNALLPEVI